MKKVRENAIKNQETPENKRCQTQTELVRQATGTQSYPLLTEVRTGGAEPG